MWLGIHSSYIFIQSFQVGVVRHAQSNSKQEISYMSRLSLGMKLIFCMWLGIDK